MAGQVGTGKGRRVMAAQWGAVGSRQPQVGQKMQEKAGSNSVDKGEQGKAGGFWLDQGEQ